MRGLKPAAPSGSEWLRAARRGLEGLVTPEHSPPYPCPMTRPATPRADAAQPHADEATRTFAVSVARLAHDDKCEDVLLLDVRGLSQITDYLVIASGTSDRQMRAVLEHVKELGDSTGHPSFRTNTDQGGTWLLADFVDVVVHVFEPNTRAHYDLEMLWGDAPRIDWRRPADAPKPGKAR